MNNLSRNLTVNEVKNPTLLLPIIEEHTDYWLSVGGEDSTVWNTNDDIVEGVVLQNTSNGNLTVHIIDYTDDAVWPPKPMYEFTCTTVEEVINAFNTIEVGMRAKYDVA